MGDRRELPGLPDLAETVADLDTVKAQTYQ
jgi:hypothetical protein